MIYIKEFDFPDIDEESSVLAGICETCYDTFYPFRVLSQKRITELRLGDITVLYGSNGSGKTTILNAVAGKLGIAHSALYNRSCFFEDYIGICDCKTEKKYPKESILITSDDIFDYMQDMRSLNQGIDMRREELFDEYLSDKYDGDFRFSSQDDLDKLRRINMARKYTKSQYIRKRLGGNIREHSNGESAFRYFADKITENRLYLLDEPENSLSPRRQSELADFISDSARFFGCQFIIASHSPFLAAIPGAVIYDLDSEGNKPVNWTELDGVKVYYEFFVNHADDFRK